MKPSPLRDRLAGILVLALRQAGAVELRRQPAEIIVDELMQAVADATPAEIVEEGTYLLGASHLWSDTQGSKATEHMVRRITASDQIVRSRLELEVARLREAAKEGSDLRARLTGVTWSSRAVMLEVQRVMERRD